MAGHHSIHQIWACAHLFGTLTLFYLQNFFLSRHFSEIKAIWLAYDSLFTSRLWKNYLISMGSGGWLHKGKVLTPFMFVVLYENLSTLFYFFCAINLLNFFWGKEEWWLEEDGGWLKGKKEGFLFRFFFDSEGLGPLPTYPWGIRTL